MAESYCGKTCDVCSLKESGACPGCTLGPGNLISGSCRIGKCCRNKGHEHCGTCSIQGTCATLQEREGMVARRQKEHEAEMARLEAAAHRAPILAKWLSPLFWLVIPSTVASILTQESLTSALPAALLPGQILAALCALAYGVILLQLTPANSRYRVSGWCYIAAEVFTLAAHTISALDSTSVWIILPSIVGIAANYVGIYQEFMAHSDALDGVDAILSDQWKNLWKWNVRTLYVLLAGCVLLYTLPVRIIALILLIAGAVMGVVVSILKLVYLYKTWARFRDYRAG